MGKGGKLKAWFLRLSTNGHSLCFGALSQVAKKNYEKYGNPDGPGGMKIGVGLPRFLVEEANQLFVLSFFFLFLLVVLPMIFLCYYQRQKKYSRKLIGLASVIHVRLRLFGTSVLFMKFRVLSKWSHGRNCAVLDTVHD